MPASFTADGFLCPGDIGHKDQDGHVFRVDRLKDMTISGGEGVHGPQVESVLLAHPGVVAETVKAVVVREPGSTAGETDIIDFCRERLAHYQ